MSREGEGLRGGLPSKVSPSISTFSSSRSREPFRAKQQNKEWSNSSFHRERPIPQRKAHSTEKGPFHSPVPEQLVKYKLRFRVF